MTFCLFQDAVLSLLEKRLITRVTSGTLFCLIIFYIETMKN